MYEITGSCRRWPRMSRPLMSSVTEPPLHSWEGRRRNSSITHHSRLWFMWSEGPHKRQRKQYGIIQLCVFIVLWVGCWGSIFNKGLTYKQLCGITFNILGRQAQKHELKMKLFQNVNIFSLLFAKQQHKEIKYVSLGAWLGPVSLAQALVSERQSGPVLVQIHSISWVFIVLKCFNVSTIFKSLFLTPRISVSKKINK